MKLRQLIKYKGRTCDEGGGCDDGERDGGARLLPARDGAEDGTRTKEGGDRGTATKEHAEYPRCTREIAEDDDARAPCSRTV